MSKTRNALIRAELKSAAAGKLQDPDDVRLIDIKDLELDDDGGVTPETAASAISELIEAKPYLRFGGDRRPKGDGDGGARGGHAKKRPSIEARLKRIKESTRIS